MINAKRWTGAVGLSADEIKADRSPLPFVMAIAASLLTAGLMRHVFVSAGVGGIGGGLLGGLEQVATNQIQSDMEDRAAPDPRVGAKRPPVGADRALPGPQVARAEICATVSD